VENLPAASVPTDAV